MINKKAAAMSFWIEVILMVILFVGAIGIISLNMNDYYGQSNDLTYGLTTNNTLQQVKSLQQTISNSTSQGQSSLTTFGFFVFSAVPNMILTSLSVIFNFISGGFINQLISIMELGDYGSIITVVFTLLYFLAIGFILIKLVLKVNP